MIKQTIDNVINAAVGSYELNVTGENRPIYVNFIMDQLKAHPEYDLQYAMKTRRGSEFKRPYFHLMVDELYLFAVFIRQQKVKEHELQEGVLIDSNDRLKLLAARGIHNYLWRDEPLFKLYKRRHYVSKKRINGANLPDYIDIINELGNHPVVVNTWGRKTSYYDIGSRGKRSNQLKVVKS